MKIIRFRIPKVIFDMHVHGRDMDQKRKTTVQQVMAEGMKALISIFSFMPNTIPPIINLDVLKRYLGLIKKAAKELNNQFDQYVWFGVTDNNLELCDLALGYDNVIGLKIYPLSPDGKGVTTGTIGVMYDEVILAAMRLVRKYNKVLAVHCDDPIILSRSFGNPIVAEVEYLKKIFRLAERVPGVKIMICHVSNRQSAELILAAQAKGRRVVIELCAHYLWFDKEGHNWNPNLGPAFYLCLNNLRGPEDREYLVSLLATDNPLIIISTDDAWHLEEEKLSKKPPVGIPSIREMVPAIVTLAIQNGISEARVYQLLSGNPSKVFNIPVPEKLVEYEWELRIDDVLYNDGKVVNPWNGSKLYFPILKATNIFY